MSYKKITRESLLKNFGEKDLLQLRPNALYEGSDIRIYSQKLGDEGFSTFDAFLKKVPSTYYPPGKLHQSIIDFFRQTLQSFSLINVDLGGDPPPPEVFNFFVAKKNSHILIWNKNNLKIKVNYLFKFVNLFSHKVYYIADSIDCEFSQSGFKVSSKIQIPFDNLSFNKHIICPNIPKEYFDLSLLENIKHDINNR